MATYTRVTLSQIWDELKRRTGGVFWSRPEFTDAANEAICVWQCLTGQWVGRMDKPATGALFYSIPHQIVSLQRVYYNNVPLTLCSMTELGYLMSGYDASGTPLFWAPNGLNEVQIAPVPTSGSLGFEGIRDAPRLFNGGDFIDIGDEDLQRLYEYMHHYLAFKEGTLEFSSAQPFMKKFLEAAGLRNARIIQTAMYRKWMGIMRDEGERPMAAEKKEVGVRG